MSKVKENFNRITLNDIVKISEDDLKQQLLAWIDERGVSKALQSKLRADLFQHFNQTTLGRQMALQHQQTHRIVLSPLILVLNTLVAEFLCAENCHFTLSVFATEVPYKNALPNFEATPNKQTFRFGGSELDDIFNAIGLTPTNAKIVRDLYAKETNETAQTKSLLFSIFKALIAEKQQKSTATTMNNDAFVERPTKSSPRTTDCRRCMKTQNSTKAFRVNSKYFKYLNRYLDTLAQRIREMSRNLSEIHSRNNVKSVQCSLTDATVAQEKNLKEMLNKTVENLSELNKSTHKTRKFRQIVDSVDRLSENLAKCSNNLENILLLTKQILKLPEVVSKTTTTAKASVPTTSSSASLTAPASAPMQTIPLVNENNATAKQCIDEVDYSTWLQSLQTTTNGQRFVGRLQSSLQQSLKNEEQHLEKIYIEKMENYRSLIKSHYKQKYLKNAKASGASSKATLVVSTVPTSEPTELKKSTSKISIRSDQVNAANKILLKALAMRSNEKEQYVERIVESAKYEINFVRSFLVSRLNRFLSQFLSFLSSLARRHRLQELEQESEKIDKSFQAYLKRQTIEKTRLSEDISKIWQNYNLEKSILDLHNGHTKVNAIVDKQQCETPRKSIETLAAQPNNNVLPTKLSTVSNFNLLLTEQSPTKRNGNVSKLFENPLKNFSIENFLMNVDKPKNANVNDGIHGTNQLIETNEINQNDADKENECEQSSSDFTSYGKLPGQTNEPKISVNQMANERIDQLPTKLNLFDEIAHSITPIDVETQQTNVDSERGKVNALSQTKSETIDDVGSDDVDNVNGKNWENNETNCIRNESNETNIIDGTDKGSMAFEMAKEMAKEIAIVSTTDDELDQSLDISIGIARETSSPGDEWI